MGKTNKKLGTTRTKKMSSLKKSTCGKMIIKYTMKYWETTIWTKLNKIQSHTLQQKMPIRLMSLIKINLQKKILWRVKVGPNKLWIWWEGPPSKPTLSPTTKSISPKNGSWTPFSLNHGWKTMNTWCQPPLLCWDSLRTIGKISNNLPSPINYRKNSCSNSLIALKGK